MLSWAGSKQGWSSKAAAQLRREFLCCLCILRERQAALGPWHLIHHMAWALGSMHSCPRRLFVAQTHTRLVACPSLRLYYHVHIAQLKLYVLSRPRLQYPAAMAHSSALHVAARSLQHNQRGYIQVLAMAMNMYVDMRIRDQIPQASTSSPASSEWLQCGFGIRLIIKRVLTAPFLPSSDSAS